MELQEKIEDLTALVTMESALNDLIVLVSADGYIPKVDVTKDIDGYPHVHVYITNNLVEA